MKILNSIALVSVMAVSSSAAMAQAKDDHKDHQPETSTQPAATKGNAPSNQASQDMVIKMDEQMKSMQEIHQKMINAKTPEERNVIMTDNMKAMQAGMSVMKDAGIMSMPMKNSMAMKDGMPMMESMHLQHQMMQKRMEMMTNMMQMMMDRM